MRLTLTAVLCILALGALLSAAAKPVKIDPAYAARFQSQRGDYMLPAVTWLAMAPQAYYRVYGVWPETWQALRASGLMQVDLLSPEGYVIDPDDAKWDGVYDTRYVYRGPKQAPLLVTKPDGKLEKSEEIGLPAWTIQQYLTEQGQLDGQDYSFLSREEGRVKLIALRAMLAEAIRLFGEQYGRLPSGMDELLQSGLAPLDAASLNPLTGAPFKGDGSANDYRYETFKAGRYAQNAGGRWFRLVIIDGEGNAWRLEF